MSDEKRDFEADRKLWNNLPGVTWHFWISAGADNGHYGLEAHMPNLGTFDFAYLSAMDDYGSPSHEQLEAAGRFIEESREGWKAALDEIEVLRKIIHDLQLDSEAYQMGVEAGKAEEAKKHKALEKELNDLRWAVALAGGSTSYSTIRPSGKPLSPLTNESVSDALKRQQRLCEQLQMGLPLGYTPPTIRITPPEWLTTDEDKSSGT